MQPVIIKSIRLKVPAKFTWLKYVNGINLSHHCAKSLLGEYEERWGRYGSHPLIKPIECPYSPFYYFCAVTPYYHTNIHVAWKHKDGAIMIIDDDLVYMVVENAEQIVFDNQFIDWSLPQSKDWAYNTCRNWWFASYLHSLGY